MYLKKRLLQLSPVVILIAIQATLCAAQEFSPCESYGRSAAIFLGKIVAIEPITITLENMDGGGTYPANLIRYSVDERFKGEAKTTEEAVNAKTLPKSARKVGERYLVYTFFPTQHVEPDYRTERAVPILQASAEVSYLRSFKNREPVAQVSGKIQQHSFDLINWKLTPVTPPAGVRIFLQNRDGVRRETRTGENNTFRFSNVVAGVYKVIIETPPKLYTPVTELPVDLNREPCSHADFLLQSDGRISGKIVDAEAKPAIYVDVNLIPVELLPLDESSSTNREIHGLGARADDQGSYEIRGIPPGRYLLGVNLAAMPEVGWNVFSRTFYPGTLERSHATVVELSEAQQKEGFDFSLPPRLTTRSITGSVVFADGSPAVCAMVGLIDARLAKDHWAGTQVRVENDGRFTRTGIDGFKYAVQAFTPVIDKKGRTVGYVAAPSVEVVATEKTESVKLVMPSEANCDFLTKERPRP